MSDPQCISQAPNQPDVCCDGRRTFCKCCIGVMAVTSAAMVGFPIAAFLSLPEQLEANKPLEVPLDRLSAGQAQYLELRGQQLIVLAMQDGPSVFSASCPHLGCNVIWDAGEGIFRCPCHGAMFDSTGKVIRGPVSAPLSKVEFQIKDGKLIVM
ncbi:ubiquinol-cytochrome c reductase iron-sulfur subunit [Fontivita pretiosa]|uniref:QcrA and Rieske domain-containing protein n=1 Tax=Fontivita pretiosa TaxID=2989684 RepID=UPI003D187261